MRVPNLNFHAQWRYDGNGPLTKRWKVRLPDGRCFITRSVLRRDVRKEYPSAIFIRRES